MLLSVWSLKRRVFDNQPSLYRCSVCALQYVNLLFIDYRVYTEVCSVRSINTERYRPKCRLGSLVVRALDSRLDGREFDSRPPRLILGWATVFGRAGKPLQHFTKPPRPTQRPTLSGTGNEYHTVKSEWTDCHYFVFGSASLLYIECAGMVHSF